MFITNSFKITNLKNGKVHQLFGWLTEIKDTRRRTVYTAMRLAVYRAIAGLLVALGLPAIAAQGNKNVLVLYSNGRLVPANIKVDHGLRQTTTSGDRPVNLFDEFLDEPRFSGQTYVRTVATYLREKYESQPPDVLVAFGEEALRFFLDHRAELPFSRAPVVYAAFPGGSWSPFSRCRPTWSASRSNTTSPAPSIRRCAGDPRPGD